MSKQKKYYVYVHRYASGPKRGQVFYVGKGSGKRAVSTSGRNLYWKRVVNKYGYTHETMMCFHEEVCSFSFERSLINFYGRETLVNLTDGGEGPSGATRGREAKDKMKEYHKNRPKVHNEKISKSKTGEKHHLFISDIFEFENITTGELFEGTRFDFNKYTGIPRNHIKLLCDGTHTAAREWKIKGRKSRLDKVNFKNVLS